MHGHTTVSRFDAGAEQVSVGWIGADPELAMGHAEARNTQGFSLLYGGETDAALMSFTAGLYLSPGPSLHASLLYGRATGRLQAGDLLGAVVDFDQVIPLYSGDDYRTSHALVNRAQALRMLGAWEAAVRDASAVLAFGSPPRDQVGFAHAMLGHAHQARGDRASAESSFLRAMELAAGTAAEPHADLCLAMLHRAANEQAAAVRYARGVIAHPMARPGERAAAESLLAAPG